jgi:outer membrane lipoprotein SlyB
MDYQGLLGKTWTISWSNANDYTGVAQNDTLQFTADKRIERLNGGTPLGDWATSCVVQEDGISGFRSSDGREFRIQVDSPTLDSPTRLSCRFVDTAARQRRSAATALSAVLGALIGAAAGLAAGSPFAGALTGLAAALTGSLVTTAATGSPQQRFDASGVWIAEDGGPGRRPALPYPRAAEA